MLYCPGCTVELRLADRQGIEIDHCPQCRGVWLDRGELDKIIERSLATTTSRGRVEDEDILDRERDGEERYTRRGRRRKSFLGELFDFD